MIYIPTFIKTGSGTEKLGGGLQSHTNRMVISNIYFLFFQNKENRLKTANSSNNYFKIILYLLC
jgi:hypothetical protein